MGISWITEGEFYARPGEPVARPGQRILLDHILEEQVIGPRGFYQMDPEEADLNGEAPPEMNAQDMFVDNVGHNQPLVQPQNERVHVIFANQPEPLDEHAEFSD